MKLTYACPTCHKPAAIQSEFALGKLTHYVYQCGHIELRDKITTKPEPIKVPEPTYQELYHDLDQWVEDGGAYKKGAHEQPEYIHGSFYSVDRSKCAYEFQREGIEFVEKSQCNALIADAMGLGKTIQAIITLKRNPILLPALILVKSATLFQWQHELHEWFSHDFTSIIPVTSRLHLIPGFKVYLLSMDFLSRKGILDTLLTLGIKSIIIDEVQNFKDPEALRTISLLKLIKLGNIQFKIPLSGTPIKNRAVEYFPTLNMLSPQYFNSLHNFKTRWLAQNEKGVYTRLNPYRAAEFKELTSKWIIRREKHEVLKNLPPLSRDYQIIEIDDPNFKNSYNNTVDLFKNFLNDESEAKSCQNILGWLVKLRAITGQAKCKNAIEWINDFLESSEESLAVGIHHHSVRDTLYYILENQGMRPLKLSGEDSAYRKADIVRQFMSGNNRVLVINTLAGGIGLNLQNCAQALVIERQWNSADEEQFECRFHRDGQKSAVTITYLVAKGTVDEFFHDMVTAKRKILVDTGFGSELDLTTDMNFLKELSEFVVRHKI